MSGTLYGVAFWVLLCVLGTLVWPFLLVLPKLTWRWKLTRATVRLLCACVAIPVETAGVGLTGESCVYVANHVSFLDWFAIGLEFPEPVSRGRRRPLAQAGRRSVPPPDRGRVRGKPTGGG